MINKKNIWALTLFSLILVLSVYYITMPSEFLASTLTSKEEKENVKDTTATENETITALNVENDEEKEKEMKELQTILTDEDASNDEKNNAYEKLKSLNILKGKENDLEEKIKNQYKLENFVKIDEDKVQVVIIKDGNDAKLASNIMKLVQDNFDNKVYVTIKFQK